MEESKLNQEKTISPVPDLKERITRGVEKFNRAVGGQSKDVAVIIRCHLLAEYYLDQILQFNLKRGDLVITDGRFTFSSKLLLVRALCVVDDEILTAIKHLNTVRNRCSHQLEYIVSEADIDLIGQPFGKDYFKQKQIASDSFALLVFVLTRIIAPLDIICMSFVRQ